MALVTCQECGEEVSTKAKACPKCGEKAPKKTSLFTWLVFLFIIFVVYAANQNSTLTSSYSNSKIKLSDTTNSINSETPKKVISPKPSWATSTSKDKMTGKFSAYASSPTVYLSKIMSFPYSDVNSWMGIGCDSKNEWVYFGLNSAPNLTKDETKDGYNLIETRIKWNDQLENVTLTQDWGAKFIHFRNDSSVMSKIVASSSALLEL